jgi:hypothetical protein
MTARSGASLAQDGAQLRKIALFHQQRDSARVGACGRMAPAAKYVCGHTLFATKEGGVTAQTSTKEGG